MTVRNEIIQNLWNWEIITYNPNLTLDFIKRHFNENWYWDELTTIVPLFNKRKNRYG